MASCCLTVGFTNVGDDVGRVFRSGALTTWADQLKWLCNGLIDEAGLLTIEGAEFIEHTGQEAKEYWDSQG